MVMLLTPLLLLSILVFLAQAEVFLSFSNLIPPDGSDLAQFVTRPDLRPPTYDVLIHNPDLVSPGYIFVAPYERIHPELRTKKFIPAQVGPHIYDGNGNLIWSGAQTFRNRNTYSFRPMSHEWDSNLAFAWDTVQENIDFTTGAGLIMNASYDIISHILPSHGYAQYDMHEFNVLPNGKTALRVTTIPLQTDVSHLNRKLKSLWLNHEGFQEIDLKTGQIIFDWWALDHLDLEGGWVGFPTHLTSIEKPWDIFHINSVDKDYYSGNYLVSMRHYSAVFMISHKDGSVIWQLGGNNSTVQLTNPFVSNAHAQNYSFVGQHDARFHNCHSILSIPSDCPADKYGEEDTTFISLFDNAATELQPNVTSRSLLIAINNPSKKATVVQQHLRPDGGLSHKRGNVQYLSNGNVFVGWSVQGYLSEHIELPDGQSKCVMEAAFRSPRMGMYRAYKFDNFIGWSREKIAFKHFAYGPTPAKTVRDQGVHVFYVSWNGATEVETWVFYRANSPKGQRTKLGEPPAKEKFIRVGNSPRTGFETSFTARGWSEWAWVEAIDINGNVLGSSAKIRVVTPQNWELDNQVTEEEGLLDQSVAGPRTKTKPKSKPTPKSKPKSKPKSTGRKSKPLKTEQFTNDTVALHEKSAYIEEPVTSQGRYVLCLASLVAAFALFVLRRRFRRSFFASTSPSNMKLRDFKI